MEEYLVNLMFYVLIIGVVIFLVYYPKKIEQRKLKELQDNLKIGDNITTYSGLVGIIEQIENDYIIIKIKPDDIRITIEKWAVIQVNI